MQFYSPVQPINDPILTHLDISLSIKRDDLIDPLISGNKWRKLKYLIRRAQLEKKNHLVTFGGAYSNHLLATAAACARFGLKSTGFVRGEQVENDMLLICKLMGMQLIFTDRASYRDKANLFDQHFGVDDAVFFIDEGGASYEGTLGCSEIIDELDTHYNHIFCASGTGTTAAGLINGIANKGINTELHAVPVLKDGAFIADEINKYLTNPHPYTLHLDYHFGGYAKVTDELLHFIIGFTQRTGILIDPVYTGKMLFCIYHLAQKAHFAPGTSILALHTGGTFGILGMKDKFRKLLS